MYFTLMDSFKDCLRESKTFYIKVEAVGGGIYRSSNIPIDLLEDVVGDIDLVQVDGIGLTIWDRELRSSITFARGMIFSVVIVYNVE